MRVVSVKLASVVKPFRPETRDTRLRGPYRPVRDLAQAFGDRLADLRELSGLTVRDLSTRSGLPSGTVSGLLTGKHQPSLRQLLALQRGLGLASLDELLGSPPSLGFNALPDTDQDPSD